MSKILGTRKISLKHFAAVMTLCLIAGMVTASDQKPNIPTWRVKPIYQSKIDISEAVSKGVEWLVST